MNVKWETKRYDSWKSGGLLGQFKKFE